MLILKNGRLLTMAGPEFVGDIAVENGKIAAIGENLLAENAEVRDISGCYVLPGIVDAHCHIGMWEDGMGREGSATNARIRSRRSCAQSTPSTHMTAALRRHALRALRPASQAPAVQTL